VKNDLFYFFANKLVAEKKYEAIASGRGA